MYRYYALLVAFLLLLLPSNNLADGELMITNEKEESNATVELNDAGDLTATLSTDDGLPTTIDDGTLQIDRVLGGNDLKLIISDYELRVKGEIIENNANDPVIGEMQIENKQTATVPIQSYLGFNGNNDGDLFLKGLLELNPTPISMVAYLDDFVFEKDVLSHTPQFAYSLVGREGKIIESDICHYYIKDHLGSTRMVFDDQLNLVDAVAYQAYGTQMPLIEPSDEAREKFTGKELDKEGNVGLIDLNITLSSFVDIPTTVTNENTLFTVVYKPEGGGPTEEKKLEMQVSHVSSEIWLKHSFALSDNKTVDMLLITIENTVPEVSYLLDITDQEVSSGDSLYVELNQNVNDIPYDQNIVSSPDFYITHYEFEAFCGINMDYFGARYYDPEVGIFISTDPADYYWNSYSYVGGNPIILTDQTGAIPDIAYLNELLEAGMYDVYNDYIALNFELYHLDFDMWYLLQELPIAFSHSVLQNIVNSYNPIYIITFSQASLIGGQGGNYAYGVAKSIKSGQTYELTCLGEAIIGCDFSIAMEGGGQYGWPGGKGLAVSGGYLVFTASLMLNENLVPVGGTGGAGVGVTPISGAAVKTSTTLKIVDFNENFIPNPDLHVQ